MSAKRSLITASVLLFTAQTLMAQNAPHGGGLEGGYGVPVKTSRESVSENRSEIAEECSANTTPQEDDTIPIKPVKMLGVRLGEHISKYKVTKVVKLGEYGDRYIIDPSTVDRPGDMGLYKWEYSASVNSKGIVYEVYCKMESAQSPFGMKENEPKGPPLDLFPAIREVYPEQEDYDGPQKFTVKGKEGFLIGVESKMIGRDDYGLWWSGDIHLYHKATTYDEFRKKNDKSKDDIRRRNKDL